MNHGINSKETCWLKMRVTDRGTHLPVMLPLFVVAKLPPPTRAVPIVTEDRNEYKRRPQIFHVKR